MRRVWFCVPLLLALSLMTSVAVGAPNAKDRQEAQQLSKAGTALVKQGKFDEAAGKFKAADDLNPAPSYKLELARMLIEMQDFIGAGDTLRAAVEAKPRQWAEKQAQKKCVTLLEEVNQRTPKLSISVFEPEASKVKITVDGSEFDPGAGALDYNPGDYEVVAKADGYDTFTKKVTLADSAIEELEITMTKSAGGAGTADGDEGATESSGEGISAIWAYSAWGVGVVGIALGIGFGVAAINTTNDVLQLYDCEDGECPPEAEDDLNRALLNGNVSTAGFVIGGVGIAAGTVLFFFSDAWLDGDADEGTDTEGSEGAFKVEARPLLGPGYIGVSGTF